ncbi:Cell cycle control protein 50A, partial [Orchesella cincta]
ENTANILTMENDQTDYSRSSPKKKSGFFNDLKQQRITAWKLRYTESSVSPVFIGYGAFLVALGIAVLLVSSNNSSDIKEFKIDYTFCANVANVSVTCAEYIQNPQIWSMENFQICQCKVQFELTKPMKGDKIYIYYALENFHQNLRKYVKSKDDDQLLGLIGSSEQPAEPVKDCQPFDRDDNGTIIFPCGAVANSMFNDSIQLYYEHDLQGDVPIVQRRRGIAWSTDVGYKFKNPPEFYNKSHPIWGRFTKPKDWNRTIWDLDDSDPENNGMENEDFMVWMRTAAFSKFRKMYRIIDTASQDILETGLPAGTYHLKINYTYEVTSFQGTKGIVLTAPTIFGQQNMFQGIFSISLGGISLVLGLLFLLCGYTCRHGKGSFTKSNVVMD